MIESRWLRLSFLVGFMGLIYVFSGNEVPPMVLHAEVGSGLPMGNLVHIGAYAILGALVYWSVMGLGRFEWRLVVVVVFCVVYGASDELHQGFVTGRDGSVFDVALDGLGSLLTIVGLVVIKMRRGSSPSGEL